MFSNLAMEGRYWILLLRSRVSFPYYCVSDFKKKSPQFFLKCIGSSMELNFPNGLSRVFPNLRDRFFKWMILVLMFK